MSGQAMITVYIRPRRSAWWHRVETMTAKVERGVRLGPTIRGNPAGHPVALGFVASNRLKATTACGRDYDGAGYNLAVNGRPDRGRFCGRCG